MFLYNVQELTARSASCFFMKSYPPDLTQYRIFTVQHFFPVYLNFYKKT